MEMCSQGRYDTCQWERLLICEVYLVKNYFMHLILTSDTQCFSANLSGRFT